MTRIIAGSARGRRLAVPAGTRTRPTSDRTREGLFSAVQSAVGPLDGLRVLDLYAGSGAVGLEALSRGAAAATLVEADAKALRAIRDNVRGLGLAGAVVLPEKVERALATAPPEPYDVVFADPPYDLSDAALTAVLAALVANGWLAVDALLVVERSSRGGPVAWPPGIEAARSRRYGEGTLWYGRAAPQEGLPPHREDECAEPSVPAPSTP